MKKIISLTCLAVGAFSALQAGEVTSHTFFTVRPHFQSASPERVSFFRNDLLELCEERYGGAFELVLYGSRTTGQGSEKLAQYFAPSNACGGCCFNAKESIPAQPFQTQSVPSQLIGHDGDPSKNVDVSHFNIATVNGTFSSQVCFNPEQSVFGLGLVYKQIVSRKEDGHPRFYIEASLPVERVRNKMGLVERVFDDGGGPLNEPALDGSFYVANMTEAFAQSNWNFGKISCGCPTEKWGIADVELKVGYNYHTSEHALFTSYLGLVLPTGTKVKSRYVFEPIVGNNRHFGVMWGSTIGFDLWECWGWEITMFVDSMARYLFKNNQIRSFDLVGKTWGRYMETYNSPEQAFQASPTQQDSIGLGTSGINLFTTCVEVRPHFQTDINTAWLFAKEGSCGTWMGEVGWNFFARQAESLELDCCNPIDGVALKGRPGLGDTTIARTIRDNFVNSDNTINQTYLGLGLCDIDLESASHPAVISQTIYGTFGFRWDREYNHFFGVGASYESQPHDINTALHRWTVWAKGGFAF